MKTRHVLPSLALLTLTALASAQVKVSINKPKGTETERVVLPGETVELFGRISGGGTDAGTWSKTDSGGQRSTLTADPSGEVHATVVMGPASAPCPFGKSAPFTLAGPVFTTVTLASAEDPSKTSTQILYSCTPSIVAVHTIPSYRTIYAGQLGDTFSFTEGLVDQSGTWIIAAQPPGGDGALSSDTNSRDVVFHATVPGRYRIRRSSPNPAATAAETVYFVTGHPMPYPVTANGTVPVDPSVDPALKGKSFDIGPSQTFKSFAAAMHAAGNAIPCGSTFRFVNEDTTGGAPTTLHEFLSLGEHCPLDQPIRFVGQPDRAGHLPVLSGDHATTRPNIPSEYLFDAGAGAGFHTFLHEPSRFPRYTGPQSLVFEGIRVQDFNKDHTFCPAGAAKGPTCTASEKNWGEGAAGIHIQSGVAIGVNGVDIDGNGNGLFVGFNAGQENWNSLSSDLAFFGDRVSNSGVAGRNGMHSAYLQGRFTVVSGLHVLSYRAGAEGVGAIKTRGSGIVITGSLFEGKGARINDHVEIQDACTYTDPNGMFYSTSGARPTEPFTGGDFASSLYTFHHDTWIYGNTYTTGSPGGMFHFSFDSTPSLCSQSGDFHFYNNTLNVRSAGAYRTFFFDTEFQGNSSGRIDQPRFEVVNNVFFNPSAVFYLNASSDPRFSFGKNLMFHQWVGKMSCPVTADVFEWGCMDDSGWTPRPGADSYTGSSLARNVSGSKKLIAAAPAAAAINPQTYRVTGNIPGEPLPPELAVFPVRFQFSPADGYQKPRSTPVTGTTGGLIGSIDSTR